MSDYFDPNNEELLRDFFNEAESQMEILEQNLLGLENNPDDSNAIDEIFRAAHTLKGSSAAVQMMEINQLVHKVEDVFDEIRNSKLKVNNEIMDLLFKSIDTVKNMLEERQNGSVYEEDTTELVQGLIGLLNKEVKPEVIQESQKQEVEAVQISLKAEELETLKEEYKDKNLVQIKIHFNVDDPMGSINGIQMYNTLKSKGELIETIPEYDLICNDDVDEYILFYLVTDIDNEELQKSLFMSDVTLDIEVINIKDVIITEEKAEVVKDKVINEVSENQADKQELIQKANGLPLYAIYVHFNEDNPMNTVSGIQIQASLSNRGNILQSDPVYDELYNDKFFEHVTYYIASDALKEDLEKASYISDVTISTNVTLINNETNIQEQKATLQAAAKPAKPVAKPADKKNQNMTPTILRVESTRIDDLLNLVSEIVINKATFSQVNSEFDTNLNNIANSHKVYESIVKSFLDRLPEYFDRSKQGENEKNLKKEIAEDFSKMNVTLNNLSGSIKNTVSKFRGASQNLNRITTELQEGVMKIRMIPIGNIFSPFQRTVRDLCKKLSKKVNLKITGQDTELDKGVAEDLKDPLMHCIRNSMDHGIEIPEIRENSGKDPEGTLSLKATNEGNMILIEISDDGAGIDVETVKRKAIEKGVLDGSKEIPDSEAFNLLFEAGLSTAKKITDVSGRGVGLDVVKTNIEKLNGNISITSERGIGTSFIIRIPLTLAIIQGLLVRVSKEMYAIPITSVIDSHRIKKDDIKLIDNYEVITIRNEVISLIRLNKIFNIPEEDNLYCYLVMVNDREKKVGILVDSLIGEEDVVIKPLKDSYTNVPGIAGANITGDGKVSLIIDIPQLLELSLKREMIIKKERELKPI